MAKSKTLLRTRMLSTRMTSDEIDRLNKCSIAPEKKKGLLNKVGQADKIVALLDFYEKHTSNEYNKSE